MLNVLHVVLGLEIGGLEKFVLGLVKGSKKEVVPHILCLQKKGALGERIFDVPIFELDCSEGIKPKVVLDIYKIIKKLKIEVIHTHNPSPHFYGALAGFFAGVPVVHTKHGRNYPGSKKKVLLNRLSTAFTSKIVAVSHEAAEVCRLTEKVPEQKIHTIWNGVDVSAFLPANGKKPLLSSLGIDDTNVVVGIVARLSPEKNHSCLLRAFAETQSEFPLGRLLIVGDGVLRQQLEAEVKSLGLGTSVIFTGSRHDVPELLREFDVFCLSSKTEGLPLTVLEAMACSLPVVATNVGGNSEAVKDGETGFLVESDDSAALGIRLKSLLGDGDLRKQMGEAGRLLAENHFDSQSTVKCYVDLYRSVARGRS
ncbi:hypothetical protein A7E78_00340 [Syntrophotalea acetylenivorans]|uniref:Glycosyltransferase n=1 Tax=Syntrophotalea acetylenivorans TaxID=1842532 RepID=A0A1L3GLB0_9BACT|nr:glycosyltransferase [Syntrophotalea acetylenivorans]APG26448.1 hypothetical protein A7E78_00340 [Syntrophotalea acetylenivorans]